MLSAIFFKRINFNEVLINKTDRKCRKAFCALRLATLEDKHKTYLDLNGTEEVRKLNESGRSLRNLMKVINFLKIWYTILMVQFRKTFPVSVDNFARLFPFTNPKHDRVVSAFSIFSEETFCVICPGFPNAMLSCLKFTLNFFRNGLLRNLRGCHTQEKYFWMLITKT